MIFDKYRFNEDQFFIHLWFLDWGFLYNLWDADSISYNFISLITGAMKQRAPLKKIVIRTPKPETKSWIRIVRWWMQVLSIFYKNDQ